ncbi:MAG: beta-galactosidase [Planctomycetota bacterium]|nr:beta-galactosidase [Planctomycetota bacterium]
MPNVSFDGFAVKVGGERKLVLSGAVHYPRSTPALWPRILSNSKAAGLNTIETYVFWNLHEHDKGRYDFTDRLDLAHFLRLCQQHGLYAILRIGPYICAETNFGGLPPWLLHEPGMVTRTNNEAFKREMLKWLRTLMSQVGDQQATRGGPVILAQLENEYNNVAKRYGDEGRKYMEWVVSIGREVGIEVPLIMCEGSAEGAIETLNGFSVAERVPEFKKHHTNMPALWTENWPGWYDTFGVAHHQRDPQEIAYNAIRFFAAGGTGVNYYMWHGGTNYGREAMYLQTTSYDFDAPLDEYGLPTTKSEHLGKLQRVLQENARYLLNTTAQVDAAVPPGEKETLPRLAKYRYSLGPSALVFLVNSTDQAHDLSVNGATLKLPPKSAAVAREGNGAEILFESAYNDTTVRIQRTWKPTRAALAFKALAEPLPDALPEGERTTFELETPVSMLPYTQDRTDYGWYQATLASSKAAEATLALPMVRDFSMLFVNGKFVGAQPERLDEDRPKHWKHDYRVTLKKGRNRITVLVAAFGLIKGDWMIDAPMSEEKKGLIGDVLLEGVPQRLQWTLDVGLQGEQRRLFDPIIGGTFKWQAPKGKARLRWFRAEFDALKADAAGYALEVGKLHKGLIWLNGQCAGRYWQVSAAKIDTSWQHDFITLTGVGHPTQRYYHLPTAWLKERNTLVIFEETEAAPDGVKIVERV